jgi:hypothetical protein
MLLSYVNTKLRDEYSSLEEFCEDNDCSIEDIYEPILAIGYVYDRERNAFIRK